LFFSLNPKKGGAKHEGKPHAEQHPIVVKIDFMSFHIVSHSTCICTKRNETQHNRLLQPI